MENIIFPHTIMKKIQSSKKREVRNILLREAGYTSLKEAKKGLNMQNAKADDVYEQLRLNYNEQVDEIRKERSRQKYREKKQIANAINKVHAFNTNGNSITFTDITPSKLKAILMSLDPTKRTVMEVDGKHYTLTLNNIQQMIEDVDQFWIQEETDYANSYNADRILRIKQVMQVTLSRPKWLGKNKNEGAFFKYYHNTELDLDRFGVHQEKQENYNENCFVQSLITLGIDDEIVKDIRSIICNKYLPTNKLTQIAQKYELYFRIKTLDQHKDTINFGNKCNKEVLLGLIDQHYFAIAPVEITIYALKNYFSLKDVTDYNQIIKKTHARSKERYTNSWQVIKYMFLNKETYLTQIPVEDLLDTQYNNLVTEIKDLNYNLTAVRENEVKPKKECDAPLVFFDFETTTNEMVHKPYMVCNSATKIQYGERCGYLMLRDLYEKFNKNHKTIMLIAHNVSYDFRFIQQYLLLENIIERGNSLLEVKGKFYYSKGRYINIILKDSYSIITMPLRKFGKCFNLEQAKEIIPYSMYTDANIKTRYLESSFCRHYCDVQVRCNNLDKIATTQDCDDYFKQFIENCSKWNCIKDGFIDIIEYSKVYCMKDVEILQEGYLKFGEMLKEGCNMDIKDFMSSAQLAHQYMLENDVFKDVNQLSSTPREYMMKCVVGGRTMCAENKMQHVQGIIDDFDAVSLYPSAMSRLGGYLKGSPKVLENRTYSFLEKQDGYFVQIKVNRVNKKFKFPLMSYINDEGVRVFTNKALDSLYVCKFELEDLIKYHQIEFTIIDGYYYNEGRNDKLKEVIDFVFSERLKLKREKNPLEQIYKLIMNSSYGKTIQKAIGDEVKFVADKDLENFIDKHYNRMSHYEELYGSTTQYKKYKVKLEKGINEHFNNAHCGVEVLAMSKRIMNEVMCLAEDNKLDIYYQDTDSMHIKHEDIEILAAKFKETYARELIGKGMGQFHTDFDSDILKGDIHAVECLFLGKKCYIDKLVGDEPGVYDYHIRMKGVPNGSIKYKAKVESRDVMSIYKSLYKGHKEVFDLCCDGDKICFEYNANFTISTKLSFTRELKFDSQLKEKDDEIIEGEVVNNKEVNHHIYIWRCDDCNSTYIGRTNNFESRRRQHTNSCNNPNDPDYNKKLYKTMREYGGVENWTMAILDSFWANDKRHAEEKEQEWIDKLDSSLQMVNPIRKQKAKEFNI